MHMCGLIGYVGTKKAVPILINGLKRLEYRGYDSAGIALMHKDMPPTHVRAVGHVAELEVACADLMECEATAGIAHTRWATHGIPSEANAHPHTDCIGSIFVAHNGIIENYTELKTELTAAGHVFSSGTDTEVLAHLVERAYKALPEDERTMLRAVQAALLHVKGAYAALFASTFDPEALIAARLSSPLTIGTGTYGMFVASDVMALAPYAKNVLYLEDYDCARITINGCHIENRTRGTRTPPYEAITADVAPPASKNGHEHFMHKEIHEAPETIENALRGRIIPETGGIRLGGLEAVAKKIKTIRALRIVACGTASYAAMTGKYMIEECAGIPVETDTGSEFRYRTLVILPDTAFMAISQSGETADTLASLREAKRHGTLTLGIVNAKESAIARETDAGIYNHAGPEISVASTKAFVSQLTILALFSVYLGRMRGMPANQERAVINALKNLPDDARKTLQQEGAIRRIAEKYRSEEHMMVLGRKYGFPLALEGALKIKEVSYIHAEGYAAGEFKHGPIALIREGIPCVFVVPQDDVYSKTKSNMEEVKARGGRIIAITTEGNAELETLAEDVIYIPKTLPMLTPILAALPLYLLAYHLAVLRGNDVDKPRNLAKSVTVE